MNDQVRQNRQALTAQAIRRRRARRLATVLGVLVGLPTLVAVVYYGFIASPQYRSVAVFTVVSGVPLEKKKGAEPGDLQSVRAHIESRAMLRALTKYYGLMEHYGSPEIDWLSRLTSAPGSEATYDYYREHFVVGNETSSTLELSVFAFSPEEAQKLAEAVVRRVQKKLDRRAEKAREEMLASPRQEVEQARDELLKVTANQPTREVEVEVARERLALALRKLEVAEAEVTRQRRRLSVVAAPSLPSEPSRPRRLWSIATVFFTALALGGVLLLMGDFVREHGKF